MLVHMSNRVVHFEIHADKKIEDAGGTVALPKHALTGIAWQAYYKDTEGNIFGIHQPDKNAQYHRSTTLL